MGQIVNSEMSRRSDCRQKGQIIKSNRSTNSIMARYSVSGKVVELWDWCPEHYPQYLELSTTTNPLTLNEIFANVNKSYLLRLSLVDSVCLKVSDLPSFPQ
ncbi:hypothetical protein DESC_60001 [Desulfosarcina cetonica]|nr:hypothetical protein DESC_60001 [Desulfosarcina cetonica]